MSVLSCCISVTGALAPPCMKKRVEAWAQEFGESFYKSGGKLFGKSCNFVIDHHWKFVIKRHIDSKV